MITVYFYHSLPLPDLHSSSVDAVSESDVAKHPILLPLHVWLRLADSTTTDLRFVLGKFSPPAQPLFLRGM